MRNKIKIYSRYNSYSEDGMIHFLGVRKGASQRKHGLSLSLETLSSNVANNTELGRGHCRLRKGHVHRLSRTGSSLILLLGGKR